MTRVPPSRFLLFFLLAAVGLWWDLYSKHVVFTDVGFPAGAVKPLVEGEYQLFAPRAGVEGESRFYLRHWVTFRLFTSFNQGALWGVGQRYTWVFASLSVLAAVGIVFWLFAWGGARSLWLTVSLALILAGTLGNLYDRLGWHGYADREGNAIRAVRDFLLFTFGDFHWPVFNFADSFLVTGASMLVLQSLVAVEARRDNGDVGNTAASKQSENAVGAAAGAPSKPERGPEN